LGSGRKYGRSAKDESQHGWVINQMVDRIDRESEVQHRKYLSDFLPIHR